MANSTSITNWLNQPAAIGKKDRKNIAELTAKYPYFVPIRYINAAQQHLSDHFTPGMLTQMLLYRSNWLLFHDFLEKVATGPQLSVESEDNTDIEEITEMIDIDSFEAVIVEKEVEEIVVANNHEEPAIYHIVSNIDETTHDTIAAEEWPIEQTETIPEVVEVMEEKVPTFKEMKEEVDNMEDVPVTEEMEPVSTITVTSDMSETDVNTVIPVEQQERISFSSLSDFMNEDEMPTQKAQVLSSIWEEEEIHVDEPVEETEAIVEYIPEEQEATAPKHGMTQEEQDAENSLIQPYYTEDYFRHEGIAISNDLDKGIEVTLGNRVEKSKDPQSLMVVMSFAEWLNYFKTKGQKDKEEIQDQKALKTMWQKEKLAAALEEENEEIPENVFNMAVNSITKEEDLASESLAEILVKQGKHDKAIDMYRKLSLRNPQKSTYFALKIESLIKG